VDNGAVAAGVLAGELVAVEAVGDGLADIRAVGREDAAVKLQLAVAVAVEGAVGDGARFHEVQTGVDGVAAGALEQQVNRTGFQLVHHRVVGDGADDEGLDDRLDTAVVARVVGVDGQDGFTAGRVVAGQRVGAAGRVGMIAVTGVGVVDGLLQQLGAEVAGDLGAVLGLFDIAARGDDAHRAGRQAGVGDVVVVGQFLGLDGDRVGHVIYQVQTGEGVALAAGILIPADQNVQTGVAVAVDRAHLVAVLEQRGKDI